MMGVVVVVMPMMMMTTTTTTMTTTMMMMGVQRRIEELQLHLADQGPSTFGTFPGTPTPPLCAATRTQNALHVHASNSALKLHLNPTTLNPQPSTLTAQCSMPLCAVACGCRR